MRSKIDLTGHKMAGLYRAPPRRSHWKRYKPNKMPDRVYRQIVRLVDGAVRDTFEHHPEYLTIAGKRNAAGSITKRVAGSLWGYAIDITEQASQRKAARGRPGAETDASLAPAATQNVTGTKDCAFFPRILNGAWGWFASCYEGAPNGGRDTASADKFWWWPR